MKEFPLVSVVAVCYNHAQYVVETLESIKNQTYPNIQLIIMDDCSTDDSVKVIKQWIDKTDYSCQLVVHEKNQGLCKTLNEALELVRGEFYQVLSCDDIILERKLQTQVDLFRSLDSDYAVLYSDTYLINENSELYHGHFIQRHRPKMLVVPSGNIYENLIDQNYIPAMSVLIKTKVIRNVGGYDENLTYEDHDVWLRIAKRHKFYFSDYKNCKYRLHDTNFHSSQEFKNKSIINSFIIYYKHHENEKVLLKLKNYIYKLYENDLHRMFIKQINFLNLTPELNYYLNSNINYKTYYKIKKVKIILSKIFK